MYLWIPVRAMFAIEAQVIATFAHANAFTPQSAIVLPAWPTATQQKMFARFVRKRALLPTGDGRYYLDQAHLVEISRARSRGLLLYIAIVVIVVIGLIIALP